MRLIITTLAIAICSVLSAQTPYPIITEDCYVKLEEGLLENLDYAEYLKLSYWGEDHRRKSDDKAIEYLKNGAHRGVIDSLFRNKIQTLKEQLGEDMLCKRLRVPPYSAFKHYVRNKYGDNPTFTFEFTLRLYCEDIEYIRQAGKTLLYKFHIDSTGLVVEDYSDYLPDDYFEVCEQYDAIKAYEVVHQARDYFGVLRASTIHVDKIDSVNFKVREDNRIKNEVIRHRYNSVDDTFYAEEPAQGFIRNQQKVEEYNHLLGRFISVENINAWKIYKFAVDAKFYGEEVDSSIINVAVLETTHSLSPGRLNKVALVKVLKREGWSKLSATDSIKNVYVLASNAIEVGYAYPEMERELQHKYGYLAGKEEPVPVEVFNQSICEGLEDEVLKFRFDYPEATGDKEIGTHLWVYSTHKRRSLIGELAFVLKYDTTIVGSKLVSRDKLKVSNEYSFSGIGNGSVFSKSIPDSLQVKVVDIAPDQVKISILGPSTYSWFDLFPISSNRVNPNTYGPLLRIDIKTDSLCSSKSNIKLSLDNDHLNSTPIKYVDYLCDQGQNQFQFKEKKVINNANLRLEFMPFRFNQLSEEAFRLGDTLTIHGAFMNDPDVEIRMRFFGSKGELSFTKILPVPKEYIVEKTCESVTFIVPQEIPYYKSGFPEKMHPISGFIRAASHSSGLKYTVIE